MTALPVVGAVTGGTPGPWTLRLWATDEPDPELAALAAAKGISIRRVPMLTNDGARIIMHGQGDDSTRVAVVECQTPYKRGQGHQAECAERDANARLIAAAPELLAALMALVERGTDSPEHNAALAAIAKATGTPS